MNILFFEALVTPTKSSTKGKCIIKKGRAFISSIMADNIEHAKEIAAKLYPDAVITF